MAPPETCHSEFSHVAIALDAALPTGSARRGLGEGVYTVSPSILLSQELRDGRWQLFTTTGIELVAKRRAIKGDGDLPRHVAFSNSGMSFRLGHGWAVGEVHVSSNRWNGGNATEVSVAPSYVWRVAKRSEILVALPIGLTSSAERLTAVMKFTFELGGD